MRYGYVRAVQTVLVGALVVGALTACNDRPTTDNQRGYTKAPLEEPGLFIKPEPLAPMTDREAPLSRPRLNQNGTVMGPDQQLPPSDTARQIHVVAKSSKKG